MCILSFVDFVYGIGRDEQKDIIAAERYRVCFKASTVLFLSAGSLTNSHGSKGGFT